MSDVKPALTPAEWAARRSDMGVSREGIEALSDLLQRGEHEDKATRKEGDVTPQEQARVLEIVGRFRWEMVDCVREAAEEWRHTMRGNLRFDAPTLHALADLLESLLPPRSTDG